MAPVLLCPDCGTKHPLEGVTGSAFPCEGCGRTLKVPAQAQAAVAERAPAPAAAAMPVDPTSTRVIPAAVAATATAPESDPIEPILPLAPLPPIGSPAAASIASVPPVAPVIPIVPPVAPVAPSEPIARGAAPRARASSVLDPVPPRWMRFLLWFVAVPLAFVIVFGLAKLFGVLTLNQYENVALDVGWSRFMPIARLMPFVALVTAGLVQGGVYGLTRWRKSRGVRPANPGPPRTESPTSKRAR